MTCKAVREDICSKWPPGGLLRSLKTLTASFETFAAPQKSTSNNSLPCSSLMPSASLMMKYPALLNTISTRPNRSNPFSKATWICSGYLTSNERTSSCEEYADRRSESPSGLRSVAITLSPCCSACSVTARPSPADAPVTETNRYCDRELSPALDAHQTKLLGSTTLLMRSPDNSEMCYHFSRNAQSLMGA